jgi:ribosomal protein S21
VLRPGGRLVAHTIPSLWYYAYGYPLYRFFERLRGKRLPANPRERWAYHHVHVNEQTPPALKRVLQRAGFLTQVRQLSSETFERESNPRVRRVMQFITRAWPLRIIFCNDIFAVGEKP